MWGGYSGGKEFLPRVLHISIARYKEQLPAQGEALDFLVSIHEEGTGITWQQNVTVSPETEEFLLTTTDLLYQWTIGKKLTARKAVSLAKKLGRVLYTTFIGKGGENFLKRITPTAILLNVDETILNLPWELFHDPFEPLAFTVPLGRLVTTRTIPRQGRDPLHEDSRIRMLVVSNPSEDLKATERELISLRKVGEHFPGLIEITELSHGVATLRSFKKTVRANDFDIIHFSGHAYLDTGIPGESGLSFADGKLTADEAYQLLWSKPPYLVFNNACESGRGLPGRRLVSAESNTNGLAAAFLSSGVYAYLGFFWPVSDVGGALFSETFYKELFMVENVGLAFLHARQRTASAFLPSGDLTGLHAILFGDAASAHRRDLAVAAA